MCACACMHVHVRLCVDAGVGDADGVDARATEEHPVGVREVPEQVPLLVLACMHARMYACMYVRSTGAGATSRARLYGCTCGAHACMCMHIDVPLLVLTEKVEQHAHWNELPTTGLEAQD